MQRLAHSSINVYQLGRSVKCIHVVSLNIIHRVIQIKYLLPLSTTSVLIWSNFLNVIGYIIYLTLLLLYSKVDYKISLHFSYHHT
jgi:hypothetical protein